jgi:hypothetical protein
VLTADEEAELFAENARLRAQLKAAHNVITAFLVEFEEMCRESDNEGAALAALSDEGGDDG